MCQSPVVASKVHSNTLTADATQKVKEGFESFDYFSNERSECFGDSSFVDLSFSLDPARKLECSDLASGDRDDIGHLIDKGKDALADVTFILQITSLVGAEQLC
jgi:hypothetical protein